MRIIARRVGNLPTNFGISGPFILDLWANTCQMEHVNLRPWPLTLEVMALLGDTGLRAPSVYQYLNFVHGLPVRKIWHTFGFILISRLGDLDLWPGNWYALLPVGCATFLPILVFLGLCGLDLWELTVLSDMWHRELNLWPWRSWRLSAIWVFVLHQYTKLEVRRPFHSEDMTHFRAQH